MCRTGIEEKRLVRALLWQGSYLLTEANGTNSSLTALYASATLNIHIWENS